MLEQLTKIGDAAQLAAESVAAGVVCAVSIAALWLVAKLIGWIE